MSVYEDDEVPSTGYFRFEVRSQFGNGAPAPTSATMQWNLSGVATPGEDYTGPLTAGSTTIPLDAGGYGFKDVEYTAVDDEEFESPSRESVIVTVTGGSVSSGTFSGTGEITTFAKSNDAKATPVEIDASAAAPAADRGKGTGSVQSPDTATTWKVKKAYVQPAGTAAHDHIKITESKPELNGVTKLKYELINNTTGPAGSTREYKVEIVSEDGQKLIAKVKVTVKF